VTGRPQLRVASWRDLPAPHGPGWQWFRACQAASTIRWRLMVAVLAVAATPRMRARAWAEGFEVALGCAEGGSCLARHRPEPTTPACITATAVIDLRLVQSPGPLQR